MEFNIEKDEFVKVLQRVQGIVEKRNTMPILANVFIESEQGNITIMASDLEIFIKDICPAIVKKKGSVTVNARKLFEIIKQLSANSIDITVGENEKVTIKSGKSRFNIMGLPSKEFPAFPQTEENKLSKIDPEILRDMIDKTSFAVSTDETRYNINGFYVEKKDSKVRIITTDGHRLSIMEKEIKGINAEKEGVILPKKGVFELRKLLDEKGDFFFGITKKSATMKKDSTVVNIRLIEGEFPDYNQVMPKDNDKKFTANREDFLEALKRVSILSSDKVRGIKFSLSKNKLLLSSSSPDIGDATEEFEVEYAGSDVEIAFNSRYFIDALNVLTDEKISVELKDSLSPVVLKLIGSVEYHYVVMPMRL